MRFSDILHIATDGLLYGRRMTALTGGTFVLDSVVITNGGSGYDVAPAVAFGGGGGSGAAATAVLLNGAVVRIDITNPGSGYTTAPSVTIDPPTDGVTATANSLLAPDSLDSVTTAGVDVAPPLVIPIVLDNTWNFYLLRDGTDAEVTPLIIRPNDYAAVTNEKVFELISTQQVRDLLALLPLTYAATTDLNLNYGLQTLPLTGDVTFTTSQRAAGKKTTIRIVSDGTIRNFTFPAWVFVGGVAPALIAASKTALLHLIAYGTADTDIVAEYTVQP